MGAKSFRAKTSATGDFKLYGAGPGDAVTASAPGYAPQTLKVSATRTLPFTLKATAATLQTHDLPLIVAFWRGQSDAWGNGGSAGLASAVPVFNATNYPGVEPDFNQCYPDGVADGYNEEYVVDQSSVARDDGWIMTFGGLNGQVPKGRIYIMKLTTSFSDGSPQQLNEVHISIVDGKAFGFSHCRS